MKLTPKHITSLVVGTVLVIPCVAVGKVIGVACGALVGAAAAYSFVDLVYDEVAEYIEQRKQKQ